ncbi:MAG TPA: SIS domain-containing protein [Gemmatimonadaceae bacterium]|nr:SIS domain-containing protein [Gemmatimonadaceae bacterium]
MNGPDRDFNRELYPFLYASDAQTRATLDEVFSQARASTLNKCADVVALRRQLRDEYCDRIAGAGAAMADRFLAGGKLLAFGNGGSATDAADAAVDCLRPPTSDWRSLPAIALSSDVGVVTGVGNDVGFEHAFSRQVIALGDPQDIAIGFTTSGSSPNVIAALSEARKRGMLCIALVGYDGGQLGKSGLADYCFVARLDYVPRIQEGHATVWHSLLDVAQTSLSRRAA